MSYAPFIFTLSFLSLKDKEFSVFFISFISLNRLIMCGRSFSLEFFSWNLNINKDGIPGIHHNLFHMLGVQGSL